MHYEINSDDAIYKLTLNSNWNAHINVRNSYSSYFDALKISDKFYWNGRDKHNASEYKYFNHLETQLRTRLQSDNITFQFDLWYTHLLLKSKNLWERSSQLTCKSLIRYSQNYSTFWYDIFAFFKYFHDFWSFWVSSTMCNFSRINFSLSLSENIIP